MVAVDDSDLGQLVALDALLAERHVTRAAHRLGITQSSMSHQLALLRARLGDPILVRSGRTMILTPRAEAMAAPLAHALDALRRVVSQAEDFAPERSRRAFTLACPDVLAPMIPELLAAIESRAPRVSLAVLAPPSELSEALASGRCDVALGPTPSEAPAVVVRPLGSVHWCVLARRGHPTVKRTLSAAQWSAHPHVVVHSGNRSPNRVAHAIGQAGVARRVGLTVPSFLAAPWVVARTDMFFTAPRELVGEIAETLGLRMLPPPIELPPVAVGAMWHERMNADAGHRWFRDVVIQTMATRLRTSARR